MKGIPRNDQEWITLNGEQVIVDKDFSLLLVELNRVGLLTEYHCAGHEGTKDTPYICFNVDAIKSCRIELCPKSADSKNTQLVIRWDRFNQDRNVYYDG